MTQDQEQQIAILKATIETSQKLLDEIKKEDAPTVEPEEKKHSTKSF